MSNLSLELLKHNALLKDDATNEEYLKWEQEHYAIINRFNQITLEEVL